MLVADIMDAVCDIVTVTDDDQLVRHIAAAVRDYSRYRPLRAFTVIQTVNGQAEYCLPNGCIGVEDVVWYPSGNVVVNSDVLLAQAKTFPVSAPDDQANRLIDAIARAADEAAARGEWRYVNGKLWLQPTPVSDGTDVYVWYLVAHSSSGSGAKEAYPTIEDWAFDAVVWLTAASVLQAQAAARANQADYTEGLTKITKGHMPDNLVALAQKYRSMALTMIS